jgi:hypothetical protein
MTAGLDPITELIAKAIVNVTAWQRRSLAHAVERPQDEYSSRVNASLPISWQVGA